MVQIGEKHFHNHPKFENLNLYSLDRVSTMIYKSRG